MKTSVAPEREKTTRCGVEVSERSTSCLRCQLVRQMYVTLVLLDCFKQYNSKREIFDVHGVIDQITLAGKHALCCAPNI